jgi:hypothetical protein
VTLEGGRIVKQGKPDSEVAHAVCCFGETGIGSKRTICTNDTTSYRSK